MPGRTLTQNSIISVIHSLTRKAPHCSSKTSRHSSTLIVFPDVAVPAPQSEASIHNASNFTRQRILHDLQESLSRNASPSRVWSHYTTLLNILGHEKLSLEIHQQVLRQCTASSAELRVSAIRRLNAGNRPTSPHIHEGRFQTIIRNIRAAGMKPTLDDYHFVLEQFAAVGHHLGAMQVYKELTQLGSTPKTKTFGLCLQAIAHCLTLPTLKINKQGKVAQTRNMIADLMHDMQKFGIPFTSVNLDLTIRVLKETSDCEGFESLMKWGYGIDLVNPDRPPVEYLGVGTISSDLGVGETTIPGLPTPQPFSTAALNTAIDILGRLGDVSRLVQAFEVLTQPLPRANQHLFTSFDDDDDFGTADGLPAAPIFASPYASPNTTTYNMLLRHLCRAGHAVFARHYLLQAIRLDRQTDRALRIDLRRKPLDAVLAPHFAINRGTLLSPFGESNRDKNVGLMRWLSTKIPRILRKKRADLEFYKQFRNRLPVFKNLRETNKTLHVSKTHLKATPPTSTTPNASASNLSSGYTVPVMQRTRCQSSKTVSVFDYDVNVPPTPSTPPPPKYLDLDLHISILERDVREIDSFSQHVSNILGRTTQRLKERLGRRVWAGKDIFLATEPGRRQKVPRERWREIVQFKPRQDYNHSADASSRRYDKKRNENDPEKAGTSLLYKRREAAPNFHRRAISTLSRSSTQHSPQAGDFYSRFHRNHLTSISS